MAVTFNEATRRLLDGKNFATVATLDPPAESDDEIRLIVRVIPEKVTNFSA